MSEYGIIANVCKPDRLLKMGSKVWLIGGTGGEGWYKFIWLGRTKKGKRLIKKWAPTNRFCNFRCAWIPEHIRKICNSLYIEGTKEYIEKIVKDLIIFVEREGCQ